MPDHRAAGRQDPHSRPQRNAGLRMPHGDVRHRQQRRLQRRHGAPRPGVRPRGARERPELRQFRRDVLDTSPGINRARYVAAALTVVRAYLAAGAPQVCGPFGSYADWSRMVRSPLVWLGEPDPILSMEKTREEDPELANIREFFDLWPIYIAARTRLYDRPHHRGCLPSAHTQRLRSANLQTASAAHRGRQGRSRYHVGRPLGMVVDEASAGDCRRPRRKRGSTSISNDQRPNYAISARLFPTRGNLAMRLCGFCGEFLAALYISHSLRCKSRVATRQSRKSRKAAYIQRIQS